MPALATIGIRPIQSRCRPATACRATRRKPRAPEPERYEKHRFRLTLRQRGSQWGAEVNEQGFEYHLPV